MVPDVTQVIVVASRKCECRCDGQRRAEGIAGVHRGGLPTFRRGNLFPSLHPPYANEIITIFIIGWMLPNCEKRLTQFDTCTNIVLSTMKIDM